MFNCQLIKDNIVSEGCIFTEQITLLGDNRNGYDSRLNSMKIIGLIFILFLVFVPATSFATGDPFLDFLLGIKDQRYVYESGGKTHYDELKALKYRDSIYMNTFQQASKKEADPESLRYYLFIGYVARTKHAASTMESMSTGLMKIFKLHSVEISTTLNELPFLIDSACYYLGNYFGFEDKHRGDLESFEKKYIPVFSEHLNQQNSRNCISLIRKNAE